MKPQTVPDLFQETKKSWLDGARATARRLLKTRSRITIEDVLKEYPLPRYLHHNTIGSVFQDKMFEANGFTISQRPISHGRAIRWWTLNDKYRNESVLDCE